MKKFIFPIISLIAIGCGFDNSTDSQNETHRGDPCDCVNAKLKVIDALQVDIDSGKLTNTESLNEAFDKILDGCMASVNNTEADSTWTNSLKGCEKFSSMMQGMASIHAQRLKLKQSVEQEFLKDVEGASEVLDKLQESTY